MGMFKIFREKCGRATSQIKKSKAEVISSQAVLDDMKKVPVHSPEFLATNSSFLRQDQTMQSSGLVSLCEDSYSESLEFKM